MMKAHKRCPTLAAPSSPFGLKAGAGSVHVPTVLQRNHSYFNPSARLLFCKLDKHGVYYRVAQAY